MLLLLLSLVFFKISSRVILRKDTKGEADDDNEPAPRERAESVYDGGTTNFLCVSGVVLIHFSSQGAINFSGNEAPLREESDGSDVTESEEED